MTDIDSKLSELKIKLKNANTCEVLTKHIVNIFETMNLFELEESWHKEEPWIAKFASELTSLELYNPQETGFFNKHKISPDIRETIIQNLEFSSSCYCVHSISPLGLTDTISHLKQLKKISNAAGSLRSILPKPESELFQIIKIADNIETANLDSTNVDEFFKQLDSYLQSLEQLHSKIPNTAYGRMNKIGSKSPKGNIPLRSWVQWMYEIWSQQLKRNFVYDGVNGVNGPSKFTEFAFDTISRVHPAIEHSQVEYAVRAFREQLDK